MTSSRTANLFSTTSSATLVHRRHELLEPASKFHMETVALEVLSSGSIHGACAPDRGWCGCPWSLEGDVCTETLVSPYHPSVVECSTVY